jgi:CheY-like chemotaxis protein
MGRTVLVVDDDPDIRVLARVTLQSAGFNVLEASSGSEALMAIDTQGPDGILLDIRMPGMDGWEVLDRLRQLDRLDDLRVVVFSAHEMASAPAKVREKGGVGYLPKPFMPEELVDAMNSALSGTEPPAAPASATGNVDEAMKANLFSGESVELSAEALSRVTLQFFHRCQVYLTDRRLVLLKPAWPWGFKLAASHQRADCVVRTVKHKVDGSSLMVIQHPAGVECLYFSRKWREQADAIVAALGGATEPAS